MSNDDRRVLLISMPFAEISIPSIQLCLLESYLKKRDINIDVSHLYLKAANIYGLKNYNLLLNSKAGSYPAQMGFSKYVFPEYFNINKQKFEEFFKKNIFSEENKDFDFETYSKKTDEFYNKVISDINWDRYDLIGFSLNYSQLLPSLAIAKKIKQDYPNIKIVLGGSRTVGEIGLNVLKTFDYIDYIVSGDGEESLYQLFINEKPGDIQNLSYRKENKIIQNKTCSSLDLNDLPFVDFNSFYEELQYCSSEIKQYYHVYGRLPLEISRGCWWNKCTFCNLNIQYKNYREKNTDRIIREIKYLSDRYKILKFQMIGNTLPLNNYRKLFKEIIKLGKDFSFIVENRAGRLKKDDFKLLEKAGFTTIQTGIETFSKSYLKKMKKGTGVIDNVASLKFCKENGIINIYNIIVGYPNEEETDFIENKKNISLFKQYLDPPNIAKLVVGFGSSIFKNPEDFNIKNLDYTKTDKLMFPDHVLKKNISFFYSFNRKENLIENDWKKLIDDWKRERKKRVTEEIDSKNIIDKHIFYFVDGKNILKIYDKRDSKNVKVYMLDDLERKIFLECIDVKSYKKLEEKFSFVEEAKLKNILTVFEKTGIIFREKEKYLSLPLRVRNKDVILEDKEEVTSEEFSLCIKNT